MSMKSNGLGRDTHMGEGDKRMFGHRRNFLAILAGLAVPLTLFARRLAVQGQGPGSPITQQPNDPERKEPELPQLKASNKAILDANEKDIKKSVEKLFELASQLKAEVEKTNSSQVLSLAMIKKAEEIEKLAKDIKARAKG